MTNESADTQLKQLLTKALDDAWNAGIEKGKAEGRRAGIEEAANAVESGNEYHRIMALLEAK